MHQFHPAVLIWILTITETSASSMTLLQSQNWRMAGFTGYKEQWLDVAVMKCHQIASPEAITPVITKDIMNITGVGSVVSKINGQGGHLHLFVKHHVGIHTVSCRVTLCSSD
jgi:hypothetical protein